jgi:integrase/recombinase XerD
MSGGDCHGTCGALLRAWSRFNLSYVEYPGSVCYSRNARPHSEKVGHGIRHGDFGGSPEGDRRCPHAGDPPRHGEHPDGRSDTLATMALESDLSSQLRWEKFPTLATHKLARKQLLIEAALGLSPNTLEAYGRAREDFLRFCETHEVEATQATKETLALWVRGMLTRPGAVRVDDSGSGSRLGLANATIQQKLTAVRLFFDYLMDQGVRISNPVGYGRYSPGRAMLGKRGLIPRHRKLPWIPNEEQWEAIIRVVAEASLRTRTMFCLAYDAALRREELCRIEISDFDFANQIATVQAEIAKGRRQRMVPYSATASQLLADYLKHRRHLRLKPGPAFLSESRRNRGEPITIWTWSKTVEGLAESSGVPQFTTHTLRHLRLTDLARSGWDIHEIALFAGHRSIETTKDYIHLSSRDLANKVRTGMDQIHKWRLRMLQESA